MSRQLYPRVLLLRVWAIANQKVQRESVRKGQEKSQLSDKKNIDNKVKMKYNYFIGKRERNSVQSI